MRALTLEHAEQLARDAIAGGDADAITRRGDMLDAIEQAQRRPVATLAASALWYASQGLKIFPLQPGLKLPYKGSRGCHDATGDQSQVAAWWAAKPDSNIGIATGTLVDVVDVDGAAGQVSRARNADLFDSLRVLGTVSTPRPGGLHVYVPATGLGNKAGMLPAVDYRGKSGYVVAPPSVNADGVPYTWIRPLDLSALAVAA